MTIYIENLIKQKEYGKGYSSYSHLMGRQLLFHAVENESGIIGISEKDIASQERGKPYFISGCSKKFSISHCDGLCVCVLSDYEIGIDCESVRSVSAGVMKRCYSSAEHTAVQNSDKPDILYSRLWTLKESYVKMNGRGVTGISPSVSFDPQENKVLFDSGCRFFNLNIADRYFISVCEKNGSCEKIEYDLIELPENTDDILSYKISDI